MGIVGAKLAARNLFDGEARQKGGAGKQIPYGRNSHALRLECVSKETAARG
jgi:hypothetical protein